MASILQPQIDYIPTFQEAGIRFNVNVTKQIFYEKFGPAIQGHPFDNWQRDKDYINTGGVSTFLLSNEIARLLRYEKISVLDNWDDFLNKVFPEVVLDYRNVCGGTYYFANKDKQRVMFINIFKKFNYQTR